MQPAQPHILAHPANPTTMSWLSKSVLYCSLAAARKLAYPDGRSESRPFSASHGGSTRAANWSMPLRFGGQETSQCRVSESCTQVPSPGDAFVASGAGMDWEDQTGEIEARI